MDLEVVGRHSLLFDDDASAAFVNSRDALVEWNSLFIDRYDVRHLLSGPPPPLSRRRHHLSGSSSPPPHPDASLEPELDRERFLDLPPPSDEQEQGKDVEPVVDGGYSAVPFSYGNLEESTEQKINDVESVFQPPFPVPESLLQNLPSTEREHQIIAKTAMFVSKHGGQSEIILRVKQGDNPTFGFLMPDHHLHAYFRFLVDHQELLRSDVEGKSLEEEKKGNYGPDQTGGALSLLGSVYGSGEDEDGTTDDQLEANTKKSQQTVDAVKETAHHLSKQMDSSVDRTVKNELVSNYKCPLKEKVLVIKRNRTINTVKSGTTSELKKEGDALGSIGTAINKSEAHAMPSTSNIGLPVLEPPSDLKRVVEKIVEFILKNGKEFESVLAEQDHKFGRFPFLLPSNQYHPYYLKVLQKTQESKLVGKGYVSEKHESTGHGMEKKTASFREGDKHFLGATDNDIPYDYDKKEKFRMVLGKSKKDGQDSPPIDKQPESGFTVDADAAAAILKAATRGIKNPNLELFSKLSWGGDDGGKSSSFGSRHASQPQSSTEKRVAVREPSVSVPVAKAIAETAALAAANEADSSEASLTREQKLKAERLKRAKMFAAMIKSGAAPAPLKAEPLRSLSVEPPGSGVSSSGNEGVNLAGKEREGSSVPADVDAKDKIEDSEKKNLVDRCNERRSKRSYRSRSNRHEEDEEEIEEQEKEEEEEDKGDHKRSRKKRRSHRSSHHEEDRHKHRKRHSSSKDRDSRHRHKHDTDKYSDDEDSHSWHRYKHNSSSDDSEHRSTHRRGKHHSSNDEEHGHSRRHYKHISSSDNDEHQDTRHRHRHKHGASSSDEYQARHRHKHGSSPDVEDRHRRRSIKHRKHRYEREAELEEGEICAKSDQSKANESDRASREASVDLSKSYQQESAPSHPTESAEVSDDLRAKIRAMLMATL